VIKKLWEAVSNVFTGMRSAFRNFQEGQKTFQGIFPTSSVFFNFLPQEFMTHNYQVFILHQIDDFRKCATSSNRHKICILLTKSLRLNCFIEIKFFWCINPTNLITHEVKMSWPYLVLMNDLLKVSLSS